MATTVTSKGQITVPKTIRDYLGLIPGSAVTSERIASAQIVLRTAESDSLAIRPYLRFPEEDPATPF